MLDIDYTLDHIIDFIEKRTIMLAKANQKGDTIRAIKLNDEIESFNKIKEVMEEVTRLEQALNGI